MKFSIKVGGHILYEGEELVASRLLEYASILKKIYWMGHMLSVVVGGGPLARRLIEIARRLGCHEAVCDEVGINVSKINALLLASLLGEVAYHSIPSNYFEAKEALSSGRVVVCGGFQPGQSTIAVAAMMAELMRADLLIVATDVDGVYTADPKEDPKATKLTKLSYRDLEKLMTFKVEAGTYKLFDLLSIKILERARIPALVVDGRDPTILLKVLRGEAVGSLIEA
ncbi:MAG: UMP kinase [Candidatus Nezhaarchaeota archaeon]|nr:UMP kinase [Candidatus Nezhaarchaeota archaeon]